MSTVYLLFIEPHSQAQLLALVAISLDVSLSQALAFSQVTILLPRFFLFSFLFFSLRCYKKHVSFPWGVGLNNFFSFFSFQCFHFLSFLCFSFLSFFFVSSLFWLPPAAVYGSSEQQLWILNPLCWPRDRTGIST